MYLIFAAIVLAFVIGVFLLKYSTDGYEINHDVSWFFGFLLCVASGITAIVYAFTVWSYISAEYKADIINREYGTNYTQKEIFYASDVIDSIRNLDRKRYEINGDLMRGGDHEK